MISTKFYAGHDEEIYLSDWAEDGNMSEDRLKELELEFLSAIVSYHQKYKARIACHKKIWEHNLHWDFISFMYME